MSIEVEIVHLNDQHPNFREDNGEIRLMHCFMCDWELDANGESLEPQQVCPQCRWEEAAAFDFNDMQMKLYEAMIWPIFHTQRSRWPRTERELRQIAAALSLSILEGSEVGSDFHFDPSLIMDMRLTLGDLEDDDEPDNETVTWGTHSNLIRITREMILNDELLRMNDSARDIAKAAVVGGIGVLPVVPLIEWPQERFEQALVTCEKFWGGRIKQWLRLKFGDLPLGTLLSPNVLEEIRVLYGRYWPDEYRENAYKRLCKLPTLPEPRQ